MATTFELISIALVTGLGSGIGNPIGQWFYKKYLEGRLDSAHNTVQTVTLKLRNGQVEIPKIDIDEKIKEMIKNEKK